MAKPHKNPKLTWERLNELFHIDPTNGVLIWKKNTGKKRMIGKIAGDLNHRFGYVCICIDRVDYKRHRLIWFYVHKQWPTADLDHIDGVRDNDGILNLREATRSQNTWNSAIPRTNKSGYKGVCWNKRANKWRAYIKAYDVWHHLGHFDNIEDAISARKQAETQYHEGYASHKDRAIGYPSSHASGCS